jgi:hypothetical protein
VHYFAGAMVAEKVVELRFRFRQKCVAVLEDNVNVFASMGMIQAQVVIGEGRRLDREAWSFTKKNEGKKGKVERRSDQ